MTNRRIYGSYTKTAKPKAKKSDNERKEYGQGRVYRTSLVRRVRTGYRRGTHTGEERNMLQERDVHKR